MNTTAACGFLGSSSSFLACSVTSVTFIIVLMVLKHHRQRWSSSSWGICLTCETCFFQIMLAQAYCWYEPNDRHQGWFWSSTWLNYQIGLSILLLFFCIESIGSQSNVHWHIVYHIWKFALIRWTGVELNILHQYNEGTRLEQVHKRRTPSAKAPGLCTCCSVFLLVLAQKL